MTRKGREEGGGTGYRKRKSELEICRTKEREKGCLTRKKNIYKEHRRR